MHNTPPSSSDLQRKLTTIYTAIHHLDETLSNITIPLHLTTHTADTLDNIADQLLLINTNTHWLPIANETNTSPTIPDTNNTIQTIIP